MTQLIGQIVDVRNRKIFPGKVIIANGKIERIESLPEAPHHFILPGFIDAHVHVESSMLVPTEFARLAVPHGTVATISDPHEIGNVLGVQGVEYMIHCGKQVNFKFYFGAPSCVPATSFETAGAEIDVADIRYLLQKPEVKYLAEMMNWPGVLHRDATILRKISAAREFGKPVDGHAPGLRDVDAKRYIAAGISTDHECYSEEEAKDKLRYGMKIIIREGSAAKNFEALIGLLPKHASQMMFCSDDKHPNDLAVSHINQLAARAVAAGCPVMDVLQAACINPIDHYKLEVGTLQQGDAADCIVVKDLTHFEVLQTYINGELVAENGQSLLPRIDVPLINRFKVSPVTLDDLKVRAEGNHVFVIIAEDGQLVTKADVLPVQKEKGLAVSDPEQDMLKIVVVNRYHEAPVAIGFIKGFGLQKGAIASSVAHDSHNIIAVGVDDESIMESVNMIIRTKGGISAVSGQRKEILPLPIAGIMTNADGYRVATEYEKLDAMAKHMGSSLTSPYMTLSFMALLVIPSLKLSDQGLFDGTQFQFRNLFATH